MPKPILIVDDSSLDSDLTLHALRRCKISNRVLFALDGEGALATLDSKARCGVNECVSLILMDINLPKMDGFEVFKRVRARPALKDIPIIFVSSSTLEIDRSRAQILGANGFVTKLAEPEEFSDLLCKAVEPYRSALS